MFWLIGNRVIMPPNTDMKVTCSTGTCSPRWRVPAGPPAPPPKQRESKYVCFFVSPRYLVRAVLHAATQRLSFICVGRKGLTSSACDVHLARQIFHPDFERGTKPPFDRASLAVFGQAYYERGGCRTLLLPSILQSLMFFVFFFFFK